MNLCSENLKLHGFLMFLPLPYKATQVARILSSIPQKTFISRPYFMMTDNLYKFKIKDDMDTLIQFARFSAKILLMAKLLQNYSNLSDLEYSRHQKARKVEKRKKKILKAKQRPEVEKPKFS